MTKTTDAPIAERFWQDSRSKAWFYEQITTMGGRKVRVFIDLDFYEFQASGRLDLWTGDKWECVTRIPGALLTTSRGRMSLAAFQDDTERLLAEARAILL